MRRWALALATVLCLGAAPPSGPVETVVIDLAAGPVGQVRRDAALGAGVDGMERGGVDRLFTTHNLTRMMAAGLGPLTYRLRTELAIEAWHWSEEGRWSDPAHRQGYWTSSDHPRRPVLTSWGYRLPRRGDTIDQAADRGYSRIDDGDRRTFWKSNPYLDPRPQWVVVAFDRPEPIDEARITWAEPFARAYQVQYWTGVDEYDSDGRWRTFPGGAVTEGRGGSERIALASHPVTARFVRLLLRTSSHGAPPGAVDARDRAGFAIAEVEFGVRGAAGALVDAVRHAPDKARQTVITVSSTDPWHRAGDRDRDLEQPGFDRVYRSGLTRGLPMMIPVGALYDTPGNAAAEIRFLKARHYAVRQVEIGEEPDGQNVSPEDFAALYVEFAKAVRAVDPHLTLGGPSLQTAASDTWLDDGANHSWTARLLAALRSEGGPGALGFFSFEHYPFDDLCGDVGAKLAQETGLLGDALGRLRRDGVPTTIPWIISEYGFSAFGGEAEVEVPGALVNADIPAQFLSSGGSAAYLFGYGPNRPFQGAKACAGQGNLMLHEADARGQALWPMPSFFAARMLTRDWLGPGANTLYAARLGTDASGAPAVVAFAARRADRRWSLLLINRGDLLQRVRPMISQGAESAPGPLPGPLEVTQYDTGLYAWRADADQGHPTRDLPPRRRFSAGPEIALPPWSLTVVRFGRVPGELRASLTRLATPRQSP